MLAILGQACAFTVVGVLYCDAPVLLLSPRGAATTLSFCCGNQNRMVQGRPQ